MIPSRLKRILMVSTIVATSIFTGCDTQASHRAQLLADSIVVMRRQIHALDSSISNLQWDYNLYKLENSKGAIDFTSTGLQEIGNGFYVVSLSIDQHLTGVMIKGRILNGTSLLHQQAQFNLEIAAQTKDITIDSIPPQNAALFEVYVPDVPIDQAHWGKMSYVRSLIHYYLKK
jgi:hypothetical protein